LGSWAAAGKQDSSVWSTGCVAVARHPGGPGGAPLK